MKKLTLCLMAAFLSLTFIPTTLKAANEITMASTKAAESAEAHALLGRLNEIKAMDKSKMSSSEKKQLRKEVRSTREKLKSMGGGIYLSVGAIIIILLILLLI